MTREQKDKENSGVPTILWWGDAEWWGRQGWMNGELRRAGFKTTGLDTQFWFVVYIYLLSITVCLHRLLKVTPYLISAFKGAYKWTTLIGRCKLGANPKKETGRHGMMEANLLHWTWIASSCRPRDAGGWYWHIETRSIFRGVQNIICGSLGRIVPGMDLSETSTKWA